MLVSAKSGTIDTVAGNGTSAYVGDGGLAVSACLNEPKSIALDGAGYLYIADAENHVIRRVDLKTGIVTTVAGRPETSPSEHDVVEIRGTSVVDQA